MTFGAKLLTFTKPTSGTPPVTQQSASLGFTPKGAIAFHANGQNTGSTTSYTAHVGLGIGFSDGTTHRCFGITSADGLTSSSTRKRESTNFIVINDDSNNLNDAATVTFQADTITLSWNTRSSSSAHIFVFVFGGSDITNVKVGDFGAALATGNQTTTGTSFTPDCELYLACDATATPNTMTSIPWHFGVARSSSKQWSIAGNSENGVDPTDTWRYQTTNKCIARLASSSGARTSQAALTTFTSTGRTLNWDDADSSAKLIYFMSIKGANIDVGNFTVTSGTGNFSPVTTTTFTPSAWLFASTGGSTSVTASEAEHRASIGAAALSERGCISIHDTDNDTNTINSKIHKGATCLQLHTAPNTLELALDFVSNNSDGCTLNKVTNTTTLGDELVMWLAMGPTAVGPQNIVKTMPTETVTLTEETLKSRGRRPTLATQTISLSDSEATLRSKIRTVTQTTSRSEALERDITFAGGQPTRLFLSNITTGLPTGTLPTAEQSALTAAVNFETDQTINRLMDRTRGTTQSSRSEPSIASTSEVIYYVARWVSPKLPTTATIAANTWTYNFATKQSSPHANFPVAGTSQPVYVCCYVWRTSTGAKVGDILDGDTASVYDEPGTSETVMHGTFAGSAVAGITANDDIIVFEAWFRITQNMSGSYTDTFYYDGGTTNTTQGTTVSNHASFIETPQTLFEVVPVTETKTIVQTVTVDDISVARNVGKRRIASRNAPTTMEDTPGVDGV